MPSRTELQGLFSQVAKARQEVPETGLLFCKGGAGVTNRGVCSITHMYVVLAHALCIIHGLFNNCRRGSSCYHVAIDQRML